MDVTITLLEFLAVLAVVVVVHEFGHFATAKAFGIQVNEFGFGFPPKLLGFRKGETVYTINLIPLGGFVKLEGENDPTKPRSLASKGAGTRFLVLVAGPFMNAVTCSGASGRPVHVHGGRDSGSSDRSRLSGREGGCAAR